MSRLELNYYSVNRTFCDVLKELRECDKTRNYAYMLSLVEELQTLGNRMEAHLYDVKDLKNLHEDISKLKKERKRLISENKALNKREDSDD